MSFLKEIHLETYFGVTATIVSFVFFGLWINAAFSNGSTEKWIHVTAPLLLFIGAVFFLTGSRKGKKNRQVAKLP